MKKLITNLFAALFLVSVVSVSSCNKDETLTPGGEYAIDNNDGIIAGEKKLSKVIPPNACFMGKTYPQWSAKWWKWSLQFPLAGHPFVDDPGFQVSAGQSGHVWFLAAPFGTVVRNCTIPKGKALFVGLLNAEASNLEGLGTTKLEQEANAKFFADHIKNLSCSIDCHAINNINFFRFKSPQFSFNAPSPWIFGSTGGNGTSVGDGYYVLLAPLSVGKHTIKYSGTFHFAIAEGDPFDYDSALDMTYNITVK
jgi:hypothetical protein